MPLTSSLPSAVQLLKLPLFFDLCNLPVTAASAPSRSSVCDNYHHCYALCDQIGSGHQDNSTHHGSDHQAVVDFLMALAKAALLSSRRNLLFHLTAINGNTTADTITDCTHYPRGRFPSVPSGINTNDVARATNALLERSFVDSGCPMHRLLRCVASSNPCHIVRLPSSRQVSALGTPHQFLLVKNAPARETRFQRAKAEHGSVFAYHGSRLENWHSILTQGLLIASQTALQVNGNHYGNGIYLSPYPRVAWLYSSSSAGTVSKELKTNETGVSGGGSLLEARVLSCLALCEVVNSDSLSKRCDTQWVCRNSDHVSVRLLFVYESSSVLDGPPLSFPVDHFMESVKRAVSFGIEVRSNC